MSLWGAFQSNAFQDSAFQIAPSAAVPITFGGWPAGREITPDEIWSYQKKLIDNLTRELEEEERETPRPPREDLRAKNIAIIRQLRAELAITEETERRRELRRKIAAAQKEKDRIFALEAQQDEEDSEFILFK